MTIRFTLVVIRTPKIDAAAEFYRNLGIEFLKEKHGKGPEHYSGKVGGTVLEIYPLSKDAPMESGGRLGFAVPKLDELLKKLRAHGVAVVEDAKETEWGYRAVVRDPDGRAVELTQS
jgi:catechol 2,3-dioxygenase-like lactoylglutathione lyase family enzyme